MKVILWLDNSIDMNRGCYIEEKFHPSGWTELRRRKWQ